VYNLWSTGTPRCPSQRDSPERIPPFRDPFHCWPALSGPCKEAQKRLKRSRNEQKRRE